MTKWLYQFLIILCWFVAGLAIPGLQRSQNQSVPASSGQVSRIVSMAPNLTEILFALGLGDKIVGVTLDSDFPPAATTKTKIGTFWLPNIEAVIATKPDIIITLGFDRQRNFAGRLKRIGYNNLILNVEKISELFEAIKTIGSATGTDKQANKLVGDIIEKLNKLSALTGTDHKIRVLWVVQREPLRVAGRDTFANELIELAGGENAMGPTLYKYPPIGSEQVIACKPDVIIEPAMNPKYMAEQQSGALEYWRRFKNIPAVTNKRICVIDGDTVSRLGPRLYEGTEAIAKCLRPELFAN